MLTNQGGYMISVVIPVFNREKTIERAIRSVINQTYNDIEIIIVDDCSTDNSANIIRKLMKEHSYMYYYRLEKNSGACVARNKGIELAKGEYIAFQDSDDEWKANKLEEQYSYMKNNNARVCFCQLLEHTSYGERKKPDIETLGFIDRNELLTESIVSTQTLMVRKECLEKVRFDPCMPRLQDYDLCIRLSEFYNFYFLNKVLVDVYAQADSISSNGKKLLEALTIIQNKYSNLLNENDAFKLYLQKGIATAKEQLGINAFRERLYYLLKKPSLGVFVKVVRNIPLISSIVNIIKNRSSKK